MSLRVGISERAEADLANQYRWYIDNAGQDIAERFLRSVHATVIQLAEHPEIGPQRRFRAPELTGIRSFPVARPFRLHLIFYRATDEHVAIERVMHGARDLPNRLLDEIEE